MELITAGLAGLTLTLLDVRFGSRGSGTACDPDLPAPSPRPYLVGAKVAAMVPMAAQRHKYTLHAHAMRHPNNTNCAYSVRLIETPYRGRRYRIQRFEMTVEAVVVVVCQFFLRLQPQEIVQIRPVPFDIHDQCKKNRTSRATQRVNVRQMR